MKKFLIFILFLLILGGTAFFLGWAQFDVPLGSYGVMRSKSHGIDHELIREGEIRWVWYKLIPTNVEISIFSPRLINHSIRSRGTLPSGDVYAALVELDTDFSWEISGDFSFSVKPEALTNLVFQENINIQEDLERLENDYTRRVEAFILRRLDVLSRDESAMEALTFMVSVPELNREIEAAFPELEKINLRIQTLRMPDYELYRAVRSLYNEYLAHQYNVLENELIRRTAESQMETRIRLDELERYGEVLSRYPILLQFLALERGLDPSRSIYE